MIRYCCRRDFKPTLDGGCGWGLGTQGRQSTVLISFAGDFRSVYRLILRLLNIGRCVLVVVVGTLIRAGERRRKATGERRRWRGEDGVNREDRSMALYLI